MPGIAVFGGTAEGRRLAEAFRDTALEIHMCVATEYGASLLPDCPNIKIHAGRMDEEEMTAFLTGLGVDCCLDATHPYAAEATRNLRLACGRAGLLYIRVRREEGEEEASAGERGPETVCRETVEEAVEFLKGTSGNILITTGSGRLEAYTRIEGYRDRCVARVLPTAQVMEKCRALGFEGKNVIGMQGPFSEEFNFCLMRQINASWLVTKNSGKEGGYEEKRRAARRAGVNVLVIGRPPESGENGMGLGEAERFLEKRFGLNRKRTVYLIGMGPGDKTLLTGQARERLRSCDVVVGAGRMLDIWPERGEKPFFQSFRGEEIAAFLDGHPEYRTAAVAYSGDIGFYSGAESLRRLLRGYRVEAVPGISSAAYFADRLGIPWDGIRQVSCHGRSGNVIPAIRSHHRVCALMGERGTAAGICEKLLDLHMEDVRMVVGERLSYPDERIVEGSPEKLRFQEFDPLSVVLFENPAPRALRAGPGIEDKLFVRGKTPMTKQEIRVLSLAKLRLSQDSLLYDIGAGTGSVAVEAALQCPRGRVYAVERRPEALDLIRENRRLFRAGNLEIVEGEAPGCLEKLPAPTHVFIGGSGGRLMDILRRAREKNKKARFVINAVTLETLARIEEIRKTFPEYENMEVLQLSVARSRPLKNFHLMSAENPVYLVCFGGEEEACGE